ncbi:hypothetical protein [Streptomyces sp. NPDC048340]|uniref:hypothetical protein n=1 Tax=Streptomyces sp. NPDC048340 TaxID=3365537 RepID=UPI003718AD02
MNPATAFSELSNILGPSPLSGGLNLRRVEEAWGISLPQEVHRLTEAYGDVMIDDYLFNYGSQTLQSLGELMSEDVRNGDGLVDDPVLPEKGGMLLWGHTIEGDKLFLVPRAAGAMWTVSAFCRTKGDWHETSLPLEEWLVQVFRGDIETEWLPEWPHRHTVEV